jgi:hypothetical protein
LTHLTPLYAVVGIADLAAAAATKTSAKPGRDDRPEVRLKRQDGCEVGRHQLDQDRGRNTARRPPPSWATESRLAAG